MISLRSWDTLKAKCAPALPHLFPSPSFRGSGSPKPGPTLARRPNNKQPHPGHLPRNPCWENLLGMSLPPALIWVFYSPLVSSLQIIQKQENQKENLDQRFNSLFKKGRRKTVVRNLGKMIYYSKVKFKFQHCQVNLRHLFLFFLFYFLGGGFFCPRDGKGGTILGNGTGWLCHPSEHLEMLP